MAVDTVQEGGEDQGGNRHVPTMLDAHADRGQAGTEPQQSEYIWNQDADRNLATRKDTRSPLAFLSFRVKRRKHAVQVPLGLIPKQS